MEWSEKLNVNRSPSKWSTEKKKTAVANSAAMNTVSFSMGFPGGSEGKASGCNAGDLGSIPGSGRFPGEGNGNPL